MKREQLVVEQHYRDKGKLRAEQREEEKERRRDKWSLEK